MRRGLFAAVLSGALIGFCGVAFADTTEDSGNGGGDAPNRQNFRDGGNRGQRGNWGGGRGGQRGNFGGGRGGFRGGPGGGFGGMGFGGMMYNRTLREGEIQAKFPKEYEAAAKQLIEAEAKLRELAKKAKVDLPADMNSSYRELRLKDPAGFAEVEKLLKSQERDERRQGMEKMRALAEKNGIKLPGPAGGMMFRRPGGDGRDGGQRGGDGPRMRDNNPRQIRLVREKFPEEFKKVNELRKAGKKQEADELLRDLMRRVAPPRPPRD